MPQQGDERIPSGMGAETEPTRLHIALCRNRLQLGMIPKNMLRRRVSPARRRFHHADSHRGHCLSRSRFRQNTDAVAQLVELVLEDCCR